MNVLGITLWHSAEDRSTELCRLTGSPDGFALEGLVLVPIDDRPGRVEYRVETDPSWRTRRASIHLTSPSSSRDLLLERDEGGRWTLDGRPEHRLEGCIDVDLRITPATNTLPIRRLRLGVGDVAELRAAWVGFPEFEVDVSEQTYERTGENGFVYRSGDFEAQLVVDDVGMVLRYGDGIWASLAHGI